MAPVLSWTAAAVVATLTATTAAAAAVTADSFVATARNGARIVVPHDWTAAAAAAGAMAATVAEAAAARGATPFVRRCGTQLCVPDNSSANGTAPVRLAGANIYWLGLDENVPPGTVAYPTPFRIWDALTTAAEVMGATVVRSHTLGISVGNPLSFEPALGVFNATALAAADYAVYVAGQLGLRLQVPLVDNYDYYHGGEVTFTNWLGIPVADFYSNATAVAAFTAYVTARLTHVNAFTGVAACDDATLMMWETGNELAAPSNWTAAIAATLKALAPRALVMDGNYGINVASLPLAAVDAYSDHFYPPDTSRLAQDASLVAAAGKVFVVGEYGWPAPSTPAFLDALESTPEVAYDAYWSLFGHADTYGFVQHDDGFTLHWPGDTPAMAAAAAALAAHAYVMAGGAPPLPPPALVLAPPLITAAGGNGSSGSGTILAWRGTPGGATYSIDAATASAAGPWTTVCAACATDNSTPVPLNATVAPPGASWLRVRPANVAGVAGPTSAVNATTAAGI